MAEIDPWKTRSDEEEADDLFFVEDGDEETANLKKKEAQDEVKKAGMLLISGSEWKEKLKETLNEAFKDEQTGKILESDADTIFESVKKASKATCLVVRRTNSKSRLEYLEKMDDHERLKKARKGKGGTGTGFLLFPRSEFGWLVITNNHVIMDEEEAKSAEVMFDHLDDDRKANITCFTVKQLVSKDIRTENAEDFKSLDFSVLALESDETEGTNFLKEHAVCRFDDGDANAICRNETILRMSGLKFVPIIAFSHPHGLGKRISIGKYPNKCEKLPESYIRHDLPTTRGSSGANMLYFHPQSHDKFVFWDSAFLHYRHQRAVTWQAIGPVLRKDLSKLK